MGYHRADGQVGTRNYWIVLPLVFCENRNVENMREALEEELGYGNVKSNYRQHVRELIERRGERPRCVGCDCDGAQESGCSPISTAFAFFLIRAAAGVRGRTRRRYADCWPAIFTIPTWPGQPC